MGGAAGTPEGDNSILLLRVRKLMDKAAATSNSHEADAFARKAAELIARHRLDPDRIATGEHDELGLRQIPLGRGAYVRARLALLAAVVSAHDAELVFGSTPDGTTAYVAGFASDLDVIAVMYHSLHAQACTQMASQRRGTPAATQRYRRSFLFGYADRLAELLAESQRAAESKATPSPGDDAGELAPALLARRRRVEAFAAERFGRVRSARAPGAAQQGPWVAGAAAAEQADVGRARLAGRRALGRG